MKNTKTTLILFPKPTKRKKPKKEKWGTKKEYMEVCLRRWEEEGKQCQTCKRPLPSPRWHNFNHTAGRRENFCNPDTIEVLCFTCHALYGGIPEQNGDWLDRA